jgi:hypothetical protein
MFIYYRYESADSVCELADTAQDRYRYLYVQRELRKDNTEGMVEQRETERGRKENRRSRKKKQRKLGRSKK